MDGLFRMRFALLLMLVLAISTECQQLNERECCQKGVEEGLKIDPSQSMRVGFCQPDTAQEQFTNAHCSGVFKQCCADQVQKSACKIGSTLAAQKSHSLRALIKRLPLGSMNILRALLSHCGHAKFQLPDLAASVNAETCCLCKHVEDHVDWEENASLKVTKKRMCQNLGCCLESSSASSLPEQADSSANAFTVEEGPTREEQHLNDEISEEAEQTTPLPISYKCGRDFRWDPEKKICTRMLTKCPRGYRMDELTQVCVPRDILETVCLPGFEYNEELDKCTDINECENPFVRCEGDNVECVNLQGFYECRCMTGFTNTTDGTCHDIDECKLGQHNCTEGQYCTNTVGNYRCMRKVPCGFGYTLNEATQECNDVDECKVDPNICGSDMICKNVRGSYLCNRKECENNMRHDNNGKCTLCLKGFRLIEHISGDPSLNTCVDVDECAGNVAKCRNNEICVNKKGGYDCKPKLDCMPGTRLNNVGSLCEDVDECVENTFVCSQHEICSNIFGSYTCVPNPCGSDQFYDYANKNCLCLSGFVMEGGKCKDLDECAENAYICQAGMACVNTLGSYECTSQSQCDPGYERSSVHEPCTDIDECASGYARCGYGLKCINTPGSYQCDCPGGYLKIDKNTCQDIDECTLFRHDESCRDPRSKCINTPGSYRCICPSGYSYVGHPTYKCMDVDECKMTPDICGSNHECVNTDGQFRCNCAPGYQHGVNSRSCVDIDECALQSRNKTQKKCPNGLCVNVEGGFECECPSGFRLDANNNVCVDIQECQEIIGICQSAGSSLEAAAVDQSCINLHGSYRCVSRDCPPNYEKSSLPDGFRCQVPLAMRCLNNSTGCRPIYPIEVNKVFIELISLTRVPRIIRKIHPVRHLFASQMRVDVREHYAYDLETKQPVNVRDIFKLRMSMTERGIIELMMLKPVTGPVDILISLYTIEEEKVITDTRLHIFITESAQDRVRRSLNIESRRQRRRRFRRYTSKWAQAVAMP